MALARTQAIASCMLVSHRAVVCCVRDNGMQVTALFRAE
jgi:hypothetical protein